MRPFLYHHIPKTAGASLNSLFGGVFGERYFVHIGQAGTHTPPHLVQLIGGSTGTVKFISGHTPLHMGAQTVGRVTRLTFLRHPVERIPSLYRFSFIMSRERRPDTGLEPERKR